MSYANPLLALIDEATRPSFAERLSRQSIEVMTGMAFYREATSIPADHQPVTWRAEHDADRRCSLGTVDFSIEENPFMELAKRLRIAVQLHDYNIPEGVSIIISQAPDEPFKFTGSFIKEDQ